MVYALINGGVVENTIVADPTFASVIAPNFDHVIQIDELDPIPAIGWTYNSETNEFTNPEYVPEE